MTFAFFFILITISLVLFAFGLKWLLRFSTDNKVKPKSKKRKGQAHSNCPLCNSSLYPGENLISRVYKGTNDKVQDCTIHGCPHCYPSLQIGIKRNCPVCHKSVPLKGHLDAHLFLRDTGKRHVHITGCTECHKKS